MNFKKYINIPYKYMGRDFDGVDCYGLMYIIYKYERKIELPDFLEIKYDKNWYKKGGNHVLDCRGSIKNTWDDVSEPYKMFDGLLFYLNSKKIVNHVGMYIGNGKFIHVHEGTNSCIERLDTKIWLSNLYSAIRYKV